MKTHIISLSWPDLWEKNLMKRDNGGRWYPIDDICKTYINENGYRSPSRSWPNSYATPLLTEKFVKWAVENHPEWAEEIGILVINNRNELLLHKNHKNLTVRKRIKELITEVS